MKAAIYNPYLDTLGGGERYSMAVAQVFAKAGYRVDVQWKNSAIKVKLENRFGINLEGVNFVGDIKKGDLYDICFWVSDGSIPLLRSRKNLLHFQIPFAGVNGKTILNKMKLFRINEIICNSYFTKKIIDREYGVISKVIYPPVDVLNIKPRRKQNLIVAIGRFSQLTQAKRQDVLIKTFKKMCDRGLKNWKFILAGGVDVGVGNYLDKLKKLTVDYPIEILENPDYKKIKELYGRAKIFWSASGYGVDENKEPKKVEHFGIAVVEAMAAKAVPVIFNSGGHKETVSDSNNGFFWVSTKQLISKTNKLINESHLLRELSLRAHRDSNIFSYDVFEKNINKII